MKEILSIWQAIFLHKDHMKQICSTWIFCSMDNICRKCDKYRVWVLISYFHDQKEHEIGEKNVNWPISTSLGKTVECECISRNLIFWCMVVFWRIKYMHGNEETLVGIWKQKKTEKSIAIFSPLFLEFCNGLNGKKCSRNWVKKRPEKSYKFQISISEFHFMMMTMIKIR